MRIKFTQGFWGSRKAVSQIVNEQPGWAELKTELRGTWGRGCYSVGCLKSNIRKLLDFIERNDASTQSLICVVNYIRAVRMGGNFVQTMFNLEEYIIKRYWESRNE